MTNRIADYVDTASALFSLPVAPEHRDAVVEAMAMILAQAALVTDFDLPETIEAAPRFVPC